MRQLALIALAFLWIAPVQAETKKAPDGFGPIKFGMTMDEAWEAIDGKGEWKRDGSLVYTITIPENPYGPNEIRVEQSFDAVGKASFANVVIASQAEFPAECTFYASATSAYIAELYNKSPVRMDHRNDHSNVTQETMFSWVFPGGEQIMLQVHFFNDPDPSSNRCSASLIYSKTKKFEETLRGIF